MDDLDLLKKDWKKQEESLPHLTYDQIYKMLWKRSSSIVKWIFIISIGEFLFGVILNIIFADKDYWADMEKYHLKEFNIWVYVISYLITFFFIFRFYQNYRKISATDNASKLMKTILKTRKTVKLYIGYVLISSVVVFIVTIWMILKNHAETAVPQVEKNMAFDTTQWLIFFGIMLLSVAILLGILWLFYRLLYGILLKRLNKNFKELKKLEMH
ncbi:hypothetical protein [Gramella sp. AN32]|uniref:Uncharacterized protein n=1 Tax=Christiangramia antarctica TaxID=2058158 RepID=A0ABW5XCW0_9FLAO|nr:hypothetical protein [Gramella sp. AN32]MCM4156579.1 hypothetical protein [Gramella sp. AN32]